MCQSTQKVCEQNVSQLLEDYVRVNGVMKKRLGFHTLTCCLLVISETKHPW